MNVITPRKRGAAFFYYKVSQTVLQRGEALYYKVGHVLLQSGACMYYKVGQVLLQSGAGITKWGIITKWCITTFLSDFFYINIFRKLIVNIFKGENYSKSKVGRCICYNPGKELF